MYLFLDNSLDGQMLIYAGEGKKWQKFAYSTVKDSDGLLVVVEKTLQKLNKNVQQVKGLAVRVGVGKFTSTRIVVTLGNTLALTLNIPIVAVVSHVGEEGEVEEKALFGLAEKIITQPIGQYVSAKYSGEANIGPKKK